MSLQMTLIMEERHHAGERVRWSEDSLAHMRTRVNGRMLCLCRPNTLSRPERCETPIEGPFFPHNLSVFVKFTAVYQHELWHLRHMEISWWSTAGLGEISLITKN